MYFDLVTCELFVLLLVLSYSNFVKSIAVSNSKVTQNVVLIKASVLTGQSPWFVAWIPFSIGRGYKQEKICQNLSSHQPAKGLGGSVLASIIGAL